jgi:hypothetical protein
MGVGALPPAAAMLHQPHVAPQRVRVLCAPLRPPATLRAAAARVLRSALLECLRRRRRRRRPGGGVCVSEVAATCDTTKPPRLALGSACAHRGGVGWGVRFQVQRLPPSAAHRALRALVHRIESQQGGARWEDVPLRLRALALSFPTEAHTACWETHHVRRRQPHGLEPVVARRPAVDHHAARPSAGGGCVPHQPRQHHHLHSRWGDAKIVLADACSPVC